MDINKQKSKLPACCESCKSNKSGDEFRKLITLTGSGLNVYVSSSGRMEPRKKDSVILHNNGDKVLKKADFFGELCHSKTKCYLCNALIQRVCNLINEVTEVKENEMIAICEHCKRYTTNKCKKCDAMVKKFLNDQINQYEYRQQALKVRLYEVRRILSLIVDRKNVCDHRICQAYYDSNAELKILLELIKSPLPSKRSDVEDYFSLMETHKVSVRENVNQDLFLKCGLLRESEENLDTITSESRSESFCICKYLRNRNIDSKQSFTFAPSTLEPVPEVIVPTEALAHKKSIPSVLEGIKEQPSGEKPLLISKKGKVKEEKKKSAKKYSGKKKVDVDDNKENIFVNKRKEEKTSDSKKISPKQNEDLKMMMQLIKNKDKERKRAEQTVKKEKIPVIPKIEDLPQIKHVEKKVESESQTSSESIIECAHEKLLHPPELIHGNRVVPFHELHNLPPHDKEPLIFKIKHELLYPEKTLTETVTNTSEKTMTLKSIPLPSVETMLPGVINYELSNTKFIEKGWTQLPSTKIVRRMNVYKMLPACPQFDWFANHKNQELFYNTGEKLAQVDGNGCGRWFYKNGRVALEYYKTKDIKAGLKYVVYDVDDLIEGKKYKPRKTLALFDHVGNGIVYDNIGNVRLKYNQSEGLVIDKKLGPPGKWKWHILNEPPVLQHVYVETLEDSDACFKGVVKHHIHDPDITKKVVSEHIIAIEFENFVKEKASKMLQKYKPFEIRIKTVKINEYFSVRIINQANIQLLFRCNQVSMKVNMGMLLISNVIVDTIMSDVGEVVTPLDQPISRSNSVTSIY